MINVIDKLLSKISVKELSAEQILLEQRILIIGLLFHNFICLTPLFDDFYITELLRCVSLYVIAIGLFLPLGWSFRTSVFPSKFRKFYLIWALASTPILWPLMPFAPTKRSISHPRSLKIIYANVLTSNNNSQPLISLIKHEQPALILLAEVNSHWLKRLNTEDLLKSYPHKTEKPREDNFGMVLYSKCPTKPIEAPSDFSEDITIIRSVHCPQEGSFTLAGVHLVPPLNDFGYNMDLRLTEIIKSNLGRHKNSPQLILGDFNSTIHGLLYRKMQAGLNDLGEGFGWNRTWNAMNPFVWFTIDHALASDHFETLRYNIGPYIGSDHYPLILELNLKTHS